MSSLKVSTLIKTVNPTGALSMQIDQQHKNANENAIGRRLDVPAFAVGNVNGSSLKVAHDSTEITQV